MQTGRKAALLYASRTGTTALLKEAERDNGALLTPRRNRCAPKRVQAQDAPTDADVADDAAPVSIIRKKATRIDPPPLEASA